MTIPNSEKDTIVIGSGIGGLACAAALAKCGRRILVLEQQAAAGGFTKSFSRHGFTWDVGVRHLGGVGPDSPSAAHLAWLSEGTLQMAPLGPVYETVHFPGGFEIQFSRPEQALRMDLKERFPASAAEIDAYFEALLEAEQAAHSMFTLRSLPHLLANLYSVWKLPAIKQWCGRTTGEVLDELIGDPKLRAVLASQWLDYGGLPHHASFGVHAAIIRSFLEGAFYPSGGAKAFAEKLIPVIEHAGGKVVLNARVEQLLVENNTVCGVRLADGATVRSPHVVSAAGVLVTVGRLLPEELRQSEWAREILSLEPSVCHLSLYLGLEGNIRAHGATLSNHSIYETWDPDASIWRNPFNSSAAPCCFVSFPSLKDPQHKPGERQKHTGDILVMVSWEAFREWENAWREGREDEYQRHKARIEQTLLKQFGRYFPKLVPLIRYHELATPLSTVHWHGSPHGAIYGVECTPRRFLSRSLDVVTPIAGLYLAGQDVVTPGVIGALNGGLLAAAAIDPRIFEHL